MYSIGKTMKSMNLQFMEVEEDVGGWYYQVLIALRQN